jgi:hypothetical protein
MTDKIILRVFKRKIRKVLWEIWDPIGVNDNPDSYDEYDGYLGAVFVLLSHDASDDELIKYLCDVETERMLLPYRDNASFAPVLSALRDLRIYETLAEPGERAGGAT